MLYLYYISYHTKQSRREETGNQLRGPNEEIKQKKYQYEARHVSFFLIDLDCNENLLNLFEMI